MRNCDLLLGVIVGAIAASRLCDGHPAPPRDCEFIPVLPCRQPCRCPCEKEKPKKKPCEDCYYRYFDRCR